MIRASCMDCVRKHIGSAIQSAEEAAVGKAYEWHKWEAAGDLDQAEQECEWKHPEFAAVIRQERLTLQSPQYRNANLEQLLIAACIVAGEADTVSMDPRNSKTFCLSAAWIRDVPELNSWFRVACEDPAFAVGLVVLDEAGNPVSLADVARDQLFRAAIEK